MPNISEWGYRAGEKKAWLGISSNILLFLLKFFAGIFGKSQAMIADAFHTASDVLTSVGVLVGFKIAKKPADEHHPFGHGRAESISAKIVSIILILIGLGIAYDSARILLSKEVRNPGIITVIAALISILVKEFTYRQVISTAKKIKSTSLMADAWHHRSDVFSSFAALIGIIGAKLGKSFMDPLAGIIVAGFIIKIGVETFHVAYDELMDAAPSDEFRKQIETITGSIQGVVSIKKIMSRKTGIEFFIEITIGVEGSKTVKQGHLVTDVIRQEIFDKMPNVRDIIVHVEPA
ncbi:MAG: cation diffusion facilitator family transporter [Candidatus Omnitrophota bacterium]|nr:cation diffusion facilitator family transporter [Candidatus Omnitrophota bacterium]MBU1895144.1 cation diffusion facilitator family transporter [Candidatus Omnitrophota bacterium]